MNHQEEHGTVHFFVRGNNLNGGYGFVHTSTGRLFFGMGGRDQTVPLLEWPNPGDTLVFERGLDRAGQPAALNWRCVREELLD